MQSCHLCYGTNALNHRKLVIQPLAIVPQLLDHHDSLAEKRFSIAETYLTIKKRLVHENVRGSFFIV